jgi:long-chain fatty acid transport protein
MTVRPLPKLVAAIIATASFVTAEASLASGFALPEASVAGIGLANAMVANPREIGAFAYNPAAMGFHETSSITLGTILIGPSFEVETASGRHDSQGADWLAGPMIQGALRLDEDWRLGVGVTAPFGLETRWEDGTFPKASGTIRLPRVPPSLDPNIPLNHPTSSKLEIIDIAPALAYRVNDNLSVAGGLDIYWVRDAQLDSTTAQLSGDGTDLGFNLSLLYNRGDWSFGAAYRSSATIGLDGDYRPLSPTLVAIGRLAPAQDASLDLDLPWRLQVGVRYELTDSLAVEVDWSRTGWSVFDELEVKGRFRQTIAADVNNWDDSNAYRIGATYDLRPTTQLRLGYAYDETGQPDDHYSARVPDSDRHLFALGLAETFGDGWAAEVGYTYVKAEERTISSTRPYVPGQDINGTDALNGDYQMHAHLIGIELSKTF